MNMLDYAGQKIVDSALKSLSDNATMSQIEALSDRPLKNAVQRILSSIEDPVNNELINTHLIQPISVYMHNSMKPYALAIICLFALITGLLLVVLAFTVRLHRKQEHRSTHLY